MAETETDTTDNNGKKPWKKDMGTELVLILFLIVGFFASMPCLCLEGVVRGRFKTIFLTMIFVRLLFAYLKRNLTPSLLIAYIFIFTVFWFLIEALH